MATCKKKGKVVADTKLCKKRISSCNRPHQCLSVNKISYYHCICPKKIPEGKSTGNHPYPSPSELPCAAAPATNTRNYQNHHTTESNPCSINESLQPCNSITHHTASKSNSHGDRNQAGNSHGDKNQPENSCGDRNQPKTSYSNENQPGYSHGDVYPSFELRAVENYHGDNRDRPRLEPSQQKSRKRSRPLPDFASNSTSEQDKAFWEMIQRCSKTKPESNRILLHPDTSEYADLHSIAQPVFPRLIPGSDYENGAFSHTNQAPALFHHSHDFKKGPELDLSNDLSIDQETTPEQVYPLDLSKPKLTESSVKLEMELCNFPYRGPDNMNRALQEISSNVQPESDQQLSHSLTGGRNENEHRQETPVKVKLARFLKARLTKRGEN